MKTRRNRILRANLQAIVVLAGLVLVALGTTLYVLQHQRIQLPLLDDPTWTLRAEFTTAQAVSPGQGQTVRVSGIRIGDITKVRLREGRALVTMEVEARYRDLVHRDASALLRPRTGLKDMFVELDPGRRGGRVPEGFTIPVAQTAPDVNTDEILAMLDTDTRAHVQLLLNGLGTGLRGRGAALGDLLRLLEPTHRDLAKVSSALSVRRANLRRLTHHLAQLNGELARSDDDLAQLVQTSGAVFERLGQREEDITATVAGLPGGLRATTRALGQVKALADALPGAERELRPVLRALTDANPRIAKAATAQAPIVASQLRPFTRVARPLVADLRGPSKDLADAEPDLDTATGKLNRLYNLAAYNPKGAEGPDVKGRDEGYLFYLGWLGHQSVNLFNSSDAHGVFRPIGLSATCQTLKSYLGQQPQQEFVLGLSPLVTAPEGCGTLAFPKASTVARRQQRKAAR